MTNEYLNFSDESLNKMLKAIIEQPKLLRDIDGILDQNAFEEKGKRALVTILKDFYKKNRYTPSYFELQIKIEHCNLTEDDKADAMKALFKAKAANIEGTEVVKEEIIAALKDRKVIYTFNEYKTNRESKGIDKSIGKVFKNIETIKNYGENHSIDVHLTDDLIRKALGKNSRELIPTGIKELDERIGGGLFKKDIGLFVAPTGYGKTTFSTIIAANAAIAGRKVWFVSFEDDIADITKKFVSRVVNRPIGEISNLEDSFAEKVTEAVNATQDMKLISENVLITRLEACQTTYEDVEKKMFEISNQTGFKADLVIIDYFDCLKHSSNDFRNEWQAQERCMRKFVNLANDYNVGVWMMQQTSKTALVKDENTSNTMSNIKGAFGITNPCSIVLTLQKSNEQFRSNRADILIAKARHSSNKEPLTNIIYDNSRLFIDCANNAIPSDPNLQYDPFADQSLKYEAAQFEQHL